MATGHTTDHFETTTLERAQAQFLSLLQSLPSESDRRTFVSWLKDSAMPAASAMASSSTSVATSRQRLHAIATDVRKRLPSADGIMASEHIAFPATGEDAGLNTNNCCHVDAFLYDEADEDEMVEAGILSRAVCRDCGSKNTEPIKFVTHSCSRGRLEYLFRGLLPPLAGRRLLDVGSRLGAVLYGAYLFSAASDIVGVELNQEHCRVTAETIEMFGLGDRARVVHAELTTASELVSSSDVIVLNNAFDWFLPADEQRAAWAFLRQTVRTGALIVSVPSIEKSLAQAKSSIIAEEWVRPVAPSVPELSALDDDEASEILLYEVINGHKAL